MVVDFALPDMSGFDLRKLSESIIIKNARSPERLLAETSLHRASAKLPPEKRKMLEEEQKVDPALNGKKVLVIDDVRNIFNLTSLLEGQYMESQGHFCAFCASLWLNSASFYKSCLL